MDAWNRDLSTGQCVHSHYVCWWDCWIENPYLFIFFKEIQSLYFLLIHKNVHSELLSPSQEGIPGVSSCVNTHSSVKQYWGLMIRATCAFLILFKKQNKTHHKLKCKELWWATQLQGTWWPSMTEMRYSCIMVGWRPPWRAFQRYGWKRVHCYHFT